MPVPYYFDYCSFVYSLKSEGVMPSDLFFLEITLVIWDLSKGSVLIFFFPAVKSIIETIIRIALCVVWTF